MTTLTRWAHSDRSYRYEMSSIRGTYETHREAALYFLTGLISDVYRIAFSNWPESESKPAEDSGASDMRWASVFGTREGVEEQIREYDQLRSLLNRSG